MVVPLGPGKFYGSSLPRPRIYTDVKLNDHRVNPPVPVLEPLLSWANEAHWSMGGLNFTRLLLQGRIEGSVSKLRAERERFAKKNEILMGSSNGTGSTGSNIKRAASDSPPPAPIATKRRRFMALIDEDEDSSGQEEEEEEESDVAASQGVRRRRLVKKLGDDFDRVASETQKRKSSPLMDLGNGSGVALRTRSRKLEEDYPSETVMKVVEEINKSTLKGKKVKSGNKGKGNGGSGSTVVSGVRTSPRLAKRR